MLLLAADAVDTVRLSSDLVASLIVSMTEGWYQLVVTSLQVDGVIRRTAFVDGVQVAQSERSLQMPSVATFLSVGAETEPSFPFAIHQLRLHSGIVSPNGTNPVTNSFVPLPYHAENSRWVEISRGLDGLDVTWSTFGWERAAREQVKVSLDPAGGFVITAENASQLWDRAVASAGANAHDHTAIANWSYAALNSTGAVGLHIDYIDSDP